MTIKKYKAIIMKKVFSIGILSLMLLQAATLTSCVLGTEQTGTGTSDPAIMELSYSVKKPAEEDLTRAVTGTADENRITGIYTLFFDPTPDATGIYIGCSYAGVTSSGNQAAGSSRVGMPAGRNSEDPYSLTVIANLDAFMDKGSHAELGDHLDALLNGKDQQWARENLMAVHTNQAGIKEQLPMSGEVNKPSGNNFAAIELQRIVARVDVENASVSNFELVSAQVWNARGEAFIIDNGVPPTAGSAVKYKGNVRNAVGNRIQTGLYFFENLVPYPVQNDYQTTCLMIAGRYGGSPGVTYYRVNIHEQGVSQDLERNHLYKIKITDVKGPGEEDIDDAYNKNEADIEYTVNDWEDGFQGGYVTDQYGNRLAVSQRFVTFGSSGGQQVEISVYCMPGPTNPITSEWSLGPISGADASVFSAISNGAANTFTINTLSENQTGNDRMASVTVNWGGLTIPVGITQLNPASHMNGINVAPSSMWFSSVSATKQMTVNLLGNFAGLAANDINVSVIYPDEIGWLTVSHNAAASDPAAGLFGYDISATSLSGVDMRTAYIKFTVTQDAKVMTGMAYVIQSSADVGEGYVRLLNISLLERNSDRITYTDKGPVIDIYKTFRGLPEGTSGADHLHFPVVEHLHMKYRIDIQSSMGWKIAAPGMAGAGLRFSMMSHPGSLSEFVRVEVTAASDVISGWNGLFYIEYENGDKTVFNVHQHGVFATLESHATGSGPTIVQDGNIYYYGIFVMNDEIWLDRNLGATSNEYYTNEGGTGMTSNSNARGLFLTRAQAEVSCPDGFRLPKRLDPGKEMDWLFGNMRWTGLGGENVGPNGNLVKLVWYMTYSTDPIKRFYIPISGNSAAATTGTTARYWLLEEGQVTLSSTNGAKSYALGNPAGGYSVRCVRDS